RPFVMGLSYQTWGVLLTLAAYVYILVRYQRRSSTAALIWACVAISYALFVLPTRSHERYMFPVIVFATLMAALAPRLWWLFASVSCIYLANLYYAYAIYQPALELRFLHETDWALYLFSLANVGLLLYVLSRALPAFSLSDWLATTGDYRPAPGDTIGVEPTGALEPTRRLGDGVWQWALARQHFLLPIALFVLALLLFVPRLGAVSRYHYDEVYHVYTASEYVKGNRMAYVWYGHAPVARGNYEWTHPPLGKLLIADSIIIFGDRPFGWRFASAFFGAIGVVVAYLLGLSVTGRQAVGLITAGLLLLDGLYMVESRTGVLDIFLLVFTLSALLVLYRYLRAPALGARWWLLGLGTLVGLGIATKWNGVPPAGLIGLVVLWRTWTLWREGRGAGGDSQARAASREHLFWAPVTMVLVPCAVYLLSYVPFFLTGHPWSEFLELQRRMLTYHSNVKATNPYHSEWWTWPLDLRPVLFYLTNETNGMRPRIYALGNPVLYWAFLPAVLAVAYRWWVRNRAGLVVLLIGFFGQWLPWALSPRLPYLYHFFPAVPFGCLAVATAMYWLWASGGVWRKVAVGYGCTVVLAFLFLYPIFAGLPLTPKEFDLRMLLNSWR
ncbi:MAG: phospholipid carrier-dependent glycosyltransferase, partial [Chloroflexota bacterium]|nr:phospholipid carrier-dependent glycosyltransferase [Chloroflexota bacterium]